VKWAQWDNTQSRELLGLFICVCSSLCTIVAHNTAQNRPDNFPSCPPDNHHCSGDVYFRERGAQTLHDVWPSPGLVHHIYIFLGLLPLDGIFWPDAKFTLRPNLAFSYIGSVTARHSSSGVSQTLRRWAEGATYIWQGAHDVGIGPHSSSILSFIV